MIVSRDKDRQGKSKIGTQRKIVRFIHSTEHGIGQQSRNFL